jgi:DNA-binding HxlR family transcriptional regulator
VEVHAARKTFGALKGKWTVEVLLALRGHRLRYGQLRAELNRDSGGTRVYDRTMQSALRVLTGEHLVTRTPGDSRAVWYELTVQGRALAEWAARPPA